MMRRAVLFLLVFVVLLVAPSVVRYVAFYNFDAAERPSVPTFDPAAEVTAVATPPASSFVDDPEAGTGAILLDVAHGNGFALDELGYLNGRIAARGFTVIPYEGGNLAAALRAVNAFVVITPLEPFTAEEVQAVAGFVNRGGRLLLMGDPTRYNAFIEEGAFDFVLVIEDNKIPLNSLSSQFDIFFKGDYLYNTIENEGNFRNIIVSQAGFGESPLTADLEQVVFYGAHSLDVGPQATPLFSGDDNTWSSATDRPGGVMLGATSQRGRVLALTDLQFLTEPYYTVYDNGRFIAHIADFLTEPSSRGYVLADFPYFYRQPVNLVYSGAPDLGPAAFEQVISLQEAFRHVNQELNLAVADDGESDALILGLYNQSADLADILVSNGISLTIEPPLPTADELDALDEEEAVDETADTEVEPEAEATPEPEPEEEIDEVRLIYTPYGNFQMSGTSLILLDDSSGQRQVIVLAASQEGLDNTVARLLEIIPLNADYATASCVLQGNLAICPSNVADEVVEAELDFSATAVADAHDEDDEETNDEDDADTDDGGEPVEDLDAIDQGSIALGDSVDGVLAEEESHAYTFSDGPAIIDIVVQGDDEMDTVLELYDADNVLITSADATFSGDAEEILGQEIPDDGNYTIVVRDYFANGGGYTLTVTEAGETSESSGDIENIFIFVDDDGDPIGEGITSADGLLALLGDSYEVAVWVASDDGPLTEELLEETDLFIWDSGDYLNPDGLLDEDMAAIFTYLDSGGPLFITGSSPGLFGEMELSTLADLEVTGDDELLLDGLTPGEVITLNDSYEVMLSDTLVEDFGEGTVSFFLSGPQSESSGEVIGVGAIDQFSDQRVVLLLLPFVALPDDVQETLLPNILNWLAAK